MDRADEEGVAYSLTYVTADVAISILIDKGLKAFKGGKAATKADDVIDVLDDGTLASEQATDFIGTSNIIDQNRMDWYEYFRDAYGKQNVCWETCNPSGVASKWQGSFPYVGVDEYTNIMLHDGDIIWMGEPYPTGYSTTGEALKVVGTDARDVFGGLQVKPYYEPGMPHAEYRATMTPYRVNEDILVADGIAVNNPQFGAGGMVQRFDPNFDFNVSIGKLTPLEEASLTLDNIQISLEEYFEMMGKIGK